MNRVIKWEKFRSVLNQWCRKEDTGKGGRPPYDVVMMFKILVLQRLYNLSDDQTEYQINDRMSFMRFLGINLCEKVPDAKTIWKFKNDLAETKTVNTLFCMFDEYLEKEGLISHKGTIVDAPRQRNSRDENKKIKNGEIPEEWEKPENKSKLAQKDIDADWTKKNGERHFGYKNHVKCDADSKLITNYSVTSASVHDSQRCLVFIGQEDEVLYADSAYSGKPIALALPENCKNQICEKGYRNSPLTSEQKMNNRRKSRIRCRIEHIFGFMTGAMHGITHAWMNIGITNLVYNLCRYSYLKRTSA